MDTLKYKDYEGTVEVDMDRCVCRGKILFINDLVTYEASRPAELKAEFEAAVDDYLETCATLGREAQKPFKGLFNVRISPALHKSLAVRALHDDVSQNEVVIRALEAYVNGSSSANHTVNLTLTVPDDRIKTLKLTPTSGTQWQETVNVH